MTNLPFPKPKKGDRESFRVDAELTARRIESGIYRDPRSEIHWDGKEYLVGADKFYRYREVWHRDKHRCVECGKYVSFLDMHPHHIARNCGERRWDNLENLSTLCGDCHIFGPEAKHH